MATSELQPVAESEACLSKAPAWWEPAREYAPTFLTEFAVMASQVIAYKLAALYLGKQGFSEYSLARRTVSLIFPVPMLGLSVALPRYVGFCQGRSDALGGSRYFGAALWCVVAGSLLCMLAMNLLAAQFAFLFFGDRAYAALAFPLSLMILGLCLHMTVCGYWRGNLQLGRANALQFLNLALLPVAVFAAFHRSLAIFLTSLGVGWTVTAAVALVFTPAYAAARDQRRPAVELLRYGLQRVPGDFTLMALFTLPATVVAHLLGVREAGFVAFGISVVSMIGAVFAPAGLVLLPKATRLIAEEKRSSLREHMGMILRVTVVCSLILAATTWLAMPRLIGVYFGPDYLPIVPVVRMLVLAAFPYSVYVVLRNLVDAYHEYGVTAAILLGGLAVFGGGLLLAFRSGSRLTPILLAFLASQVFICLAAGWESRRILRT